jgi:hypothetical protein
VVDGGAAAGVPNSPMVVPPNNEAGPDERGP